MRFIPGAYSRPIFKIQSCFSRHRIVFNQNPRNKWKGTAQLPSSAVPTQADDGSL